MKRLKKDFVKADIYPPFSFVRELRSRPQEKPRASGNDADDCACDLHHAKGIGICPKSEHIGGEGCE
jgi:hypothetical protein